MIRLSNKMFLLITAIIVSLAIFTFAVAFDVGGIGDSVNNTLGPMSSTLYAVAAAPFQWALSGGGVTLAATWIILGAFFFFGAYMIEKKVYPKLHHPHEPTVGFQAAPQSNTIPISGLQNQPSSNQQPQPPQEDKQG